MADDHAKPTLAPSDFRALKAIVHAASGIELHDGKKFLLESRLRPRLDELGLIDFRDYLARLQGDCGAEELQVLLERITIHETSFFRDAEQFAYLEHTLLPELLRRRAAVRTLRLWSAACSTGEEAYSLALAVHRCLGSRLADWSVQILGTDISPRVLEQARARLYGSEALANVPRALRRRYFTAVDGRYQLDDAVADLVRFERHNLALDDAGQRFGVFDVIFCANVFIYLDMCVRQQCLGQFERCLAADGCLLLGRSETLHGLQTKLQPLCSPQAHGWRRPLARAA